MTDHRWRPGERPSTVTTGSTGRTIVSAIAQVRRIPNGWLERLDDWGHRRHRMWLVWWACDLCEVRYLWLGRHPHPWRLVARERLAKIWRKVKR